ncbi:MAG: hypothetical protein ACLQVI_21715 [Polyangiaceae bacterium]
MHSRLIRCALAGLVLAVTGATSVTGCLDRPAVPGEPTTKTNFTTQVAEQAVDKLDILFSIDNSASMGDKQAYLSAAIPDLIGRLLQPNCIDNTNPGQVDGQSDVNGSCAAVPNSQPEFPAVHNMHIGIVSSSLGPRLGDQMPAGGAGGECLPTATITLPNPAGTQVTQNNHNDDSAHLLQRSSTTADPTTEVALADNAVGPAQGGAALSGAVPAPGSYQPTPGVGFLAWFPSTNTANAGVDAGNATVLESSGATLESDFQDLILGIHEYGCGIESQLESWYRFLIQPDPYASLTLAGANNSQATWVGVDTTIIQERHDFLRPDSLVAVIVLSDENDSEIDVRSIAGQGYLFMSTKFYPPHGLSACDTDPSGSACQSCQLNKGSSDPNCALNAYNSPTDWGYDLNLRHVHMQQKYGLDPQFPITRYVNGLTSTTVPDRTGEYPANAANYVGNNDCTNPLFAATLPSASQLSANAATQEATSDAATLCNLVNGKPNVSTQRSKSLVFYAIIGGVPWQLLHFDPTSPQNSLLTATDWVRILGTDPDTYNYTGIDPHMIESYWPRTGSGDPNNPNNVGGPTGAPTFQTAQLLPALSGVGGTSLAETAPQPPGSGSTADPYNGSEWITNTGPHLDLNVDRQYACIFKLTQPRDCSKNASGVYNVPANGYACDCSSTGLTPQELSPVCDPTNVNTQNYAKAYPTIRELNLANKLGNNGIVSSICPIDVQDNATNDDPLYGYRPAVASIINRLKNALTNQCLPQTLQAEDGGATPCLILATLPNVITKGNPQADCSLTGTYPGMGPPDPTILAEFQSAQEQAYQQGGGIGVDPTTLPTCQVNQLVGNQLVGTPPSCKASPTKGWCYVEGAAAGTCAQAILFSPGTLPTGTTINLQCIETSSALAAGQEGDGG